MLGRGRVQQQAIDELEALPETNQFRENTLLLLSKRISEKFFDTAFCPPSPPTLGGTRVNLLLKVPSGARLLGRVNRPWVAPQNWGTHGGLDVAN